MKTFLGLIAAAVALFAVQYIGPFAGTRFDGNSLDLVFGVLGLAMFLTASLFGFVHSHETRALTFALWAALWFVAFMLLPISIGSYVPPEQRQPDWTDYAFNPVIPALLFVGAVVELVRATRASVHRGSPTD
jgi:hypothetical protein